MEQTEDALRLPTNSAPSLLAFVALGLALAGTAGSLMLSLGLGLKACPLCFYQRSFIMAVLAVLTVGLAVDYSQVRFRSLLALPMAIAGFAVALFHQYHVITGTLECPLGLLGLGTAPAQSAVLFAALSLVLLITALLGEGRVAANGTAATGTVIVGLVVGWMCVLSAPPLPLAPSIPYDPERQPLDMCRPLFRGEL